MILTLLAMALGAIAGGADLDGSGVVAGALFGALVVRSIRQQRMLSALERKLEARDATAAVPVGAPPETAPSTRPDESGASGAPVALEPAPSVASTAREEAVAQPDETPAQTSPIAAQPSSEPAPDAPRDAADPLTPLRRWLFGGNTIVKVGVAILFMGLVFLAKYASEQVEVPVEWRLMGIACAALALLSVGWRLRRTRPGYAQVLQGGAVAVLFLTIFVAFRMAEVVSAGPAFALMVTVAGLAAALSVLQDAMALAVIGVLGGFSTPLLLSTGGGSHVGLFSYYLVLDLGIAAIAWFRTWRVLNLVGFTFTYLVGTAWGVLKYTPANFASGQAFLAVFFFLFLVILLLPARQSQQRHLQATERWVNGSLMFGLPTATFALQYGLVRDTEYGAALSALGLASIYVCLASVLRRRPQLALVFEGSLAVGAVLVTLVIPFALDARSTAGGWALEGAALIWLGFRQGRRLPRAAGYFLLLCAGGSLLYGGVQDGPPVRLMGAALLGGVLLSLSALAGAFFVHRHAASPTGGERDMEPSLLAWATVFWGVTALSHIHALLSEPWRLAAALAVASGLAILHAALAHRLDWPRAAMPSLLFAPMLTVAVVVSAVKQPAAWAHGGWWAWPVAFAAHLMTLRWAAQHWPTAGRHVAHVLGVLALAGLGALAGRTVTEAWGDTSTAWAWLGWLATPAALLGVLLHGKTPERWPVRDLPSAYRRTASGVLTAGLLCWSLLANFFSDGSADPLPYVPLVSPLDVALGGALLASGLWLREATATRPALGWTPLAIAGFTWLNGMLLRAFFHWGGVPFHLEAWFDSVAVHTGLTLLWATTALAVMWLSARWGQRGSWMVGAGLLAAVVVKLALVDLSGRGTVARIVSFIGAGVLMLLIGYVAPLPAPQEKAHAPQ